MLLRNRLLNAACFSPPDVPGSAPSGGSTPTPASTSPASAPAPAVSTPTAAPASSPTPAPASAAPAAEPATPTEEAFNFETVLAGNGDDLPQETVVPAAAAPAAAPVVPPVVPPVVAPAAPQQVEPVVPPVQPAPAAAAPAPTGASPPLTSADPDGLAAAITANENTIIQHVAETMFVLSPEEREALETDMFTAIPKLMAKAFVKNQHNMLKQIAQSVPRMIEHHSSVVKRNAENSDKFYSRWKDVLNKEDHGQTVNKFAFTFRQMHPNATLEQMIEDVGTMVMVAAKIPATGQPAAPAAPAPGVAFQPAPGVSPQPAPFSPAVGGGSGVPASPEENPWNFLGEQS